MEQAHLSIKNLTVRYGRTLAVDSVNFEVDKQTIVLFGPSGCGKTTILKAILGVSERGMKIDGTILYNGKPIQRDKGMIGMVFQGPVVPPWMTVHDLCRMGRNIKKYTRSEQEDRIWDMLNRFEIGALYNRYPYQLSGGEKQRVALAVTLLNEPEILLLDEPSTFIDGMTRISIWNFIEKEIYPLGIPTVIVSHDPSEAIRLADKLILLENPAKVREEIDVTLEHPRSDEVTHNQAFWKARAQLVSSDLSSRDVE